MNDHKPMETVATPARLRRGLIVQAVLMLVGWFAILGAQGARAPAASQTSAPANQAARPTTVVEGFAVIASVVAFGWAGKVRAEINRSLPSQAARCVRTRVSEAA